MKTIPTSITANEFGTSADKIEPSPSLESAGYIPSQQLPAEHMNWFMSLLTRLANADNPSLRDLWSELNTLLTAAGLSADNATTTQIKAALDALYLLKSAYGTNWLTAIQTALGADWKTALAATAGAGILAELKKVDGPGSGLDTDLVRGTTPGTGGLSLLALATLGANWLTALGTSAGAGILTQLKTVDGHGSGLDSDTCDGLGLASGAAGTLDTVPIGPLGYWVIPAGTYTFYQDCATNLPFYNQISLQCYAAGAWVGSAPVGGIVISDGVNYRVYNNSTARTLIVGYRKIA